MKRQYHNVTGGDYRHTPKKPYKLYATCNGIKSFFLGSFATIQSAEKKSSKFKKAIEASIKSGKHWYYNYIDLSEIEIDHYKQTSTVIITPTETIAYD